MAHRIEAVGDDLMGLGDQIIATGLARGAHARGKQIAFGTGSKIIWDANSPTIFKNNPNIAAPGSEGAHNLEWIKYYKGARGYNRQLPGRWEWNMQWRCKPGEIFFDEHEIVIGSNLGNGFIVMEPNVEKWKSMSVNKDWGFEKYQEVAKRLIDARQRIIQFSYPKAGRMLAGAEIIKTETFRHALAILKNAKLYVGSEGGLHHGAAAVGIPAVVLFGAWIPPKVTGYDSHINISHGNHFCGLFHPCQHCRRAMDAITVDQVHEAVGKLLCLK